MDMKRVGSQPSRQGPGEYFTGTGRVGSLNNPPAPARASSNRVAFEPGAHNGGGPVEDIRLSDVVWIALGERSIGMGLRLPCQ
jgi:hypothetical protein